MSQHLLVHPGALHGHIVVGPAKSITPVLLGLALLDLLPLDRHEATPGTSDFDEGLDVLCTWTGVDLQRCHGVSYAGETPSQQRSRVTLPLLGALAHRQGSARLPYPRGCAIGERPIDLHEHVLEHFGVTLASSDGAIVARRARAPERTPLRLPAPSRGASLQALLTAVAADDGVHALEGLATGATEVAFLISVLEQGGIADRQSADRVVVHPGRRAVLEGAVPLPVDEIEILSWVAAALYRGDEVEVTSPQNTTALGVLQHLTDLGAPIEQHGDGLRVGRWRRPPSLGLISTRDGFDSDLFAPLAVLASAGATPTRFLDDTFPERSAVYDLVNAVGNGSGSWHVHGSRRLPERLTVADLRHGFACLMLALGDPSPRILANAELLERGYPRIVTQLRDVDVHAEWISGQEHAA